MWLFGGSQRADDPSDMLVTVAAEDSFDAPELHRITAPTLLVAGGRDRFYSPELFIETAERIPNACLRLYQGKGHAGVMTYKPAIREILDFLRGDHPRT
jgi:pimeloyl-ACP methyl ester carboxylesterase